MGYTHYYTQRRNIGRAAWDEISTDLQALLKHAEHVQGIALRDWSGEGVTRPIFDGETVAFNGAGEDSHESFVVNRILPPLEEWQGRAGIRRGWSFCKTARKPYDVAVTAALCYLATIAETHTATSDGTGRDWLAGLEMARQALPRYANRIDLPMGVMERDRWCSPYPDCSAKGYSFGCMVDGRAYIIGPRGNSYRFHSHFEAAQWAESHRERRIYVESSWGSGWQGDGPLFRHSGSYNERRHAAIARQQKAAFDAMLARATGDRATPPPAYVRPGELPAMDERRAYSFAELLKAPPAALVA